MLKSSARLETPNGSKYLQQLCKHFGHKIEVTFTATEGRIVFAMGPAELRADPAGLEVDVTAEDDEGLTRARHVIDSHLERFAFREDFTGMPWRAPEPA